MRGNPQGAGREWAAAAGIVFMHGVGMLADVQWDDRNLISAGLGFWSASADCSSRPIR